MKLPHQIVAAAAGLGLLALSLLTAAQNQDKPQALTTSAQSAAISASAPARTPTVQVGDRVDPDQIKIVEQPGVYGLSVPPVGNRYAVIDDQLVRMDPESGKVLSILREVEELKE